MKAKTVAGVSGGILAVTALLGGCGKSDVGGRGAAPVAAVPSAAATTATSSVVTGADLENIRAAFQTCFATAPRGTFERADLHSACASMPIDAAFLHQGRNRSQEFDGLLADATMDGAAFLAPEILWQPTPARALARFPFRRASGSNGGFVTFAERAGETWTLVGNGREFNTFANAFANRRVPLGAGQTARLETGVILHVRNFPARFARDADIESVTVFGPGLPGTGLGLTSLPNCRFWSIAADGCANLWRVRIDDLSTGTPIPVASLGRRLRSLTADPYLTDDEIAAMPPHAVYKWVIALVPGSPTALARRSTSLSYWDRLRSRPLTSTEIAQVKFLDLTQDTLDLLQNFNGGGKPTIAWTRPENAAPAFLAAVAHGRFINFQWVGPSDTSATVGCYGNPNCEPDGSYRTGMNFTLNGNATFAMFQVMSRRNGIQVFSQYTR